LRGFLDSVALYERRVDVLAGPGVADRVRELVGESEVGALPGPSRTDLLSLLAT
jgi:hypothetical protein